MAKTELKNQMQKRAGNGLARQGDTLSTVKDMLAAQFKTLQSTIPKHVTPERLARISLTTIRGNSDLLQCSPASLVGAIMQCAKFGFEPNQAGEAFLIPYYDKHTRQKEASFQLGYIGHVQLMYRSGMVSSVQTTEVCENDEYSFEYGPGKTPYVKKATGDRGKVLYYFAYVNLTNGGFIWDYMTKEEIEKHRQKFSKMPNGFGWANNFDSMARKTVLLKVAKMAPKSAEMNAALFADNRIVKDPNRLEDADALVLPDELTQESAADEQDVPSGPAEAAPNERIDKETGEVITEGDEQDAAPDEDPPVADGEIDWSAPDMKLILAEIDALEASDVDAWQLANKKNVDTLPLDMQADIGNALQQKKKQGTNGKSKSKK